MLCEVCVRALLCECVMQAVFFVFVCVLLSVVLNSYLVCCYVVVMVVVAFVSITESIFIYGVNKIYMCNMCVYIFMYIFITIVQIIYIYVYFSIV